MKTVTVNHYQFSELSDKAKETALDECRYFNSDHEWWEFTYDDAKEIGLKITSFNLDRNRHAEGELIGMATETADKILANHGEGCETYKTAKSFIEDRDNLVARYSDGKNTDVVTEDNEYDFDQECDELENEFLKSLLEDYSMMLQRESEYLASDEAVKEMIEANEYYFTENGKIA